MRAQIPNAFLLLAKTMTVTVVSLSPLVVAMPTVEILKLICALGALWLIGFSEQHKTSN